MIKAPRKGYCSAIVGMGNRYQIDLAKMCQNQAIRQVDGVGLCGIHLNTLGDRAITVARQLEPQDV